MVKKEDKSVYFLPCGKKFIRNKECCKTLCPNLSNEEIELCYKNYKDALIKKMCKFFNKKIDEDIWYIYANIYFDINGSNV